MKPFLKILSAVTITGVIPLLYGMTVGRTRIDLVRTKISLPTPSPSPLKILHLSDLHLLGTSRIESYKLNRTVEMLKNQSVDLILITGDFIEEDSGIDPVIAFIEQLPPPTYGIFGCLGNHDYAVYGLGEIIRKAWQESPRKGVQKAKEIADCVLYDRPLYLAVQETKHVELVSKLEAVGVQILTNRSVKINEWLWIGGVDDLMEGTPDADPLIASMPENGVRLILAHHPDSLLETGVQSADIAFSGHVHGGQIRLPWIDKALYTQGSKMNKSFTSGWVRYGALPAYVSRGWGEAKGTPIRWNCRPEITQIEVE